MRSKGLVITFGLFCVWVALAILAPVIAPYDPYVQNVAHRMQGPSSLHLLGTDPIGRDLFSRLLYGGQMSLSITGIIIAITTVFGITMGAFSTFLKGVVGEIIISIIEFFLTLPSMVLTIALIGILGPSIPNIILALSVTHWAEYARVTRSLILGEMVQPYVAYARFSGTSKWREFYRYMLPNVVPHILVLVCQNTGEILLTVAGFSLIGIGIPLPYPEWGAMLMTARNYLQTAPQLMIYPGIAIFITVSLINLMGDYLRDVFDPQDYE